MSAFNDLLKRPPPNPLLHLLLPVYIPLPLHLKSWLVLQEVLEGELTFHHGLSGETLLLPFTESATCKQLMQESPDLDMQCDNLKFYRSASNTCWICA